MPMRLSWIESDAAHLLQCTCLERHGLDFSANPPSHAHLEGWHMAPTRFLPILGRACRQQDREPVLERKGRAEESRATQEEERLS